MQKDNWFSFSLLNVVRRAPVQIDELALGMFASPNIKGLAVPASKLRHILTPLCVNVPLNI